MSFQLNAVCHFVCANPALSAATMYMTGFAIICTLPLVNGATIPPSPGITPTPILRVGDRLETLSYDRERRDLSGIISSITAIPAAVTSYLGALPSDVANGILPAYTGLPTADDIKAKYNLTDEQIDAQPLQVLNVPCVLATNLRYTARTDGWRSVRAFSGYANWTSNGWQLRMHGTAYKQPPLSDSQIDDAAKPFLPNLNTSSLNSSELAESRNLTASLLVIPQSGVTLDFLLTFGEGEGDVANFTLSGQTDTIGEFNEWVGLGSLSGKNVPDGQSALNTTVVNVVSGQDANSELDELYVLSLMKTYRRGVCSWERHSVLSINRGSYHRVRHRRYPSYYPSASHVVLLLSFVSSLSIANYNRYGSRSTLQRMGLITPKRMPTDHG